MAASFSLTHQPKLSISSPIHKNMIFAKSQNQNSFVNVTSPTKINHNQKQIIMHPLLWCNSSSSSFSPRIITALNSSPMEDQNTSKEQITAEDYVKNLEEVLDDKMEKDFKTVLEQVYSDDYEGSLVQDGLIFRQNFPIRSYEIGADRTASIETLMNHLQETALNHVKSAGLLADGFGSTPEMCKTNLIWVVTRMQVLVDRYPTWGDKVQVDTWVRSSGNNGYGMCRDWLIRDCNTGEILTRASSVWVMMNKQTRRWSKMPDEVRAEIGPYFVDTPPVFEEDGRKLEKLDDKTAEHIRPNLTPRWNDLDVNQHVNNVKYIGWILESAPQSILESHELSSMTLEYWKECGRDNVLQSLTAVKGTNDGGLQDYGNVECLHLLRNEEGAEVVRGRTEWRPKHAKNFGELDQVPAGA